MTPEAAARLVLLPDPLRAWAREDPVVRLHLGAHVTHGLPLGHALAQLARALGEEGDWLLRQRLQQHEPRHPGGWYAPWCARRLPGGLRCRALARVLTQRPPAPQVTERCQDCAAAEAREGARVYGPRG